MGEDGNLYTVNESRRTGANTTVFGDSRNSKGKFHSSRYNSINIRDSVNFSNLSLDREPSKRLVGEVNIMPLLQSQTRRNMSKTMLRMKKNEKAINKESSGSRNPDFWKSLPNPGMPGKQPSLFRASQEIKYTSNTDSNMNTPDRGNTPVGFDRIYNGKSLIKKQDSSVMSPKGDDTLKKLRKE